MASTRWKQVYANTLLTGTTGVDIITAPSNTSILITKFSVSNITATAANLIIEITPFGGTKRQFWQGPVPGFPTQGGVAEIYPIEGQTLSPGDVLTVTAGTANALCPMVSGVNYTA